jgi:hypothetical protein
MCVVVVVGSAQAFQALSLQVHAHAASQSKMH